MASVAELTWLYLKRRPYLKEMLRQGIANYSALARRISMEAFGDLGKQNAVKMALVRAAAKIEASESGLEEKVLSVLRRSSMTVKSKVAAVVTTAELEGVEALSHSRSGEHRTYILEARELEKLRRMKAACRVEENLNLITIDSPEEVEEVPGVIAYILGALAGEGINVVEFISCYTDTLLVVKQADTEKAYAVLSTMME